MQLHTYIYIYIYTYIVWNVGIELQVTYICTRSSRSYVTISKYVIAIHMYVITKNQLMFALLSRMCCNIRFSLVCYAIFPIHSSNTLTFVERSSISTELRLMSYIKFYCFWLGFIIEINYNLLILVHSFKLV